MPQPENALVRDVPAKFRAIPKKVRPRSWGSSTKKYLGARNRIIPDTDYTSKKKNEHGKGEHFQGIQRIGRHLIISGGIKTGKKRSQLIVIRMGTRLVRGPWALPKYGYDYENPPSEDCIVHVEDVDETRWHAGGIQCMGNIVAVPIYSTDNDSEGFDSEIRYFEFTPGDNPLTAIPAITLDCSYTAVKAVALTRLPDNHYMTMTWDDEKLAFHYNKFEDFSKGFEIDHATVHKDDVVGGFQPGDHGWLGDGTYQSVNLIRDTDGCMYIVATRNSQKVSPTFRGSDYADLYRVAWPDNEFASPPEITLVRHRQFYCYNQQCNFGAGTGIYVDDEEHMYLYGVSHWLHGGAKRLNFNEYSYV